MEDAALSAFSVFFTQTPSFLAYQRLMEGSKGKSNAQSLFGVHRIPTDNHIRDLLDAVSPEHLFPVFEEILQVLEAQGQLESFRCLGGQSISRIGWHGILQFRQNSLSPLLNAHPEVRKNPLLS